MPIMQVNKHTVPPKPYACTAHTYVPIPSQMQGVMGPKIENTHSQEPY